MPTARHPVLSTNGSDGTCEVRLIAEVDRIPVSNSFGMHVNGFPVLLSS
jgi:hypothetical protein